MKTVLVLSTAFMFLLASSVSFAAPKKNNMKKSYSESRTYKAKQKKKGLNKKKKKFNRKKNQSAS
jgi:hypothetical protein